MQAIRLLLCWLFVGFASVASFAQPISDFGFIRSQNIRVIDSSNNELSFPFVGGLNSIRISEIDLNQDDIQDIVIFEKHGNRLLPFINMGTNIRVDYQFAPQYIHNFPELHNWAIFKDYDGDGKADIFTYGLAGVTVYKNISTPQRVQFELVTEQLTSFYYNGYTNLYASPDDYLALEDIDGDGDLDILNFWLLGKYVHYHRNYSMENYGDASHLDFRLEQECWGHFEEGADDNSIILNSSCIDGAKDEPNRHVGSTLFVKDITNNGLPDILIGDIDYPNLAFLRNGGSIDEAVMTEMDTLFPATQPINLFSMPVVNFVDVDNDGVEELIASPSDPSFSKSQDLNSVWLYKYSDENQTFEKKSERFLQNQMIDVGSSAYPVLFDWNGDGKLDLFIGNYGSFDSVTYVNGFSHSYFSSSISYFENIGTQHNPEYKLITNDFANLKQFGYLALYPTFGDLNRDGAVDMLCGNVDGTILYFENLGDGTFQSPVTLSEIAVGGYSTPQLFDLDRDGKLDLLVGNRRGQIAYYHNDSDNSPHFQFVTEHLGDVDVRDESQSYFGYSVPSFFNMGDEIYLFCGNEQGQLIYYKDITNNLDGTFRLGGIAQEQYDNHLYGIVDGMRSAPAVADLDADGFPDLLVGNCAGGLTYFAGATPIVGINDFAAETPLLEVYPNPAHDYCQLKSTAEMERVVLYDLSGSVVLQETLSGDTYARIKINTLPVGFYVGSVFTRNSKQSFKLIVE